MAIGVGTLCAERDAVYAGSDHKEGRGERIPVVSKGEMAAIVQRSQGVLSILLLL